MNHVEKLLSSGALPQHEQHATGVSMPHTILRISFRPNAACTMRCLLHITIQLVVSC
jgi:hypothetical protein